MFKKSLHSVKTVALLVAAASIFCVLFGQGTHIHQLDLHVDDHFDVHVHIHAHESHNEPLQADSEAENHQHEVSTASDINGTLTTPFNVKTDLKALAVISLDTGFSPVNRELDETPTLFDLPPPRPVLSQYYLSSFSHRGPPIA